MQRFWANFWRIWDSIGHWLLSTRGSRLAVITLLGTQVGLLAYFATRHSPTHLEPAFLAAGISHWEFGRFELYRVNPPLVRMVAALPVLAVGCKTDWSRFYDGPGSRAEFPVGEDFIKANGPASIPLFFYARWACIPFALIGGYFAYRWAKELYGGGAGLFTLLLWTFEPNLLAHAELITPDSACTSFGIAAGYWFWKWLKTPTWTHVGLAGFFLGLAELSKMSWLLLFGLWPLLWLIWQWSLWQRSKAGKQDKTNGIMPSPSFFHLTTILISAIYLINLAYIFDGSFTPLKDFRFISTALSGLDEPGTPGNRFQGTLLGELPLPLPKHFVLGFDSQKRDFEHFGQPSYLRGEWKQGGWWYYYIYGLFVKVPCGIWGIFSILILRRSLSPSRPVPLRDELVLLTPAIALLVLVSSQMEFNHHLRYTFPSLGLTLIFLGQAICIWPAGNTSLSTLGFFAGIYLAQRKHIVRLCSASLAAFSLVSTILVYPHHLAYFNESVGGPLYGWKHLLGSSFDWGQDTLYLLAYLHDHKISQAFYLTRTEAGALDPSLLGGGKHTLSNVSIRAPQRELTAEDAYQHSSKDFIPTFASTSLFCDYLDEFSQKPK